MTNTQSHHHIPENAQCVFEGIRNTIYQWDQEMYDRSTARFECNRYTDGAFVVPVLENGNILLTKQTQPGRELFVSLPGGGFDIPNEDPLECAKRELREETGYTSDDWELWFRFDGTSHVMMYVYYFIARNCQKTQEITPDPGEKIETFEVNFDTFLEFSSNPEFQHHWNLLPHMYEARLNTKEYKALREKIF
ncbi:hypothetical protein CSB09_03480 [Candidatus Gracilibacteria bacterium]|nr:MAG: hypothetical protein CSB09_03480 [Candidatus Gracilibacteria bacterium]